MAFDCSVVIPSYNRGHLIAETISSVLRQSLSPREIIVVDDGSTDNTTDVVAGYQPHVTYLRSINRGPPAARNLGVAAARMPWIALCDSDDLWAPDYLAEIARLTRAAPDVQYVFTNFTSFTDGVWTSRTVFDDLPENFWPLARREPFPGGWVLDQPLYPKLLSGAQPIFPSATALTREYLYRIGEFDERMNRTISEDLEFTLRCVRQAPIGVLAQPRVSIRRHGSNRSGDWLQSVLGSISVLRFALDHHVIPEDWRHLIREQILARSVFVIDSVFGRSNIAVLRSQAINSAELPVRLRLKTAIARLPEPLAKSIARVLVSIAELGQA